MKAIFAIGAGIFAGYMAATAIDGAGVMAQCLASLAVSFITTYGVLEVLS